MNDQRDRDPSPNQAGQQQQQDWNRQQQQPGQQHQQGKPRTDIEQDDQTDEENEASSGMIDDADQGGETARNRDDI